MKPCFIDFDGTICDFWERMYRVFIDCGHIKNVSFKNYKNAKTTLFKDSLVANHFGQVLPDDYFQNKKTFLENKIYLGLDFLIADKEFLNSFFRNKGTFIISKRRNKENLLWEIKKLGLVIDEKQVIIINPDMNISKRDYLDQFCNESFVLIGDSKEESDASSLKNCEVFLVRTGIANYDKKKKNCHYINDINDYLMKWRNYGV